MMESRWADCNDVSQMLDIIRDAGQTSVRKLRLFAVSCCRRIWSLFPNDRCRQMVEAAELFADGLISDRDLAGADNDLSHVAWDSIPPDQPDWEYVFGFALHAAEYLTEKNAITLAWGSAEHSSNASAAAASRTSGTHIQVAKEREDASQASILRDIFGNPFRLVTLDQRWLSTTVLDLAGTIYQERAFERLPILADALMDAGCDSEEIINHCHSGGQHVRGCWVVDSLLAKV